MKSAGFEQLGKQKRSVAVFGAVLLAVLALALMAGAAGAVPGDPCEPDCGGDPPVNSPPTVGVNNGSVTVSEGQQANNTGTYSDPDGSATVTLSASVGTVTKNPGGNIGTWSWSFGTNDGPDQSQTVTITASDGTDSASTTFSLNVNNVAPTVNLQNGFPSVPEGGAFANFYTSYGYTFSVSDPGNDTWTLNTGCGANGSEWVEDSSTVWCGFFDGPGSSVVSVTATDSDGAPRTSSVNVNVTNRNPDAVLTAPASINEGATATISLTKGSFQTQDGQTDTNAGFRYAFDCNGGPLTAATYANSGTSNSTTCPTTDNGTKTVRARIIDKDGGFNEYTKAITVNNVAPTATFNAPTSPVNQGSNFTLSLTGISEPSSADSLTYAFDCGDGSGYGPASSTPSKTCNAADKPTLPVKGKVIDDDGGSNEYTANVTVNNVFPTGTIQINNGAATTNNPVVNLTLSATDPLPGSGINEMRFRSEDTQTWSVWENFQTSRQWQLSDGDGAKTVFVEYRDNAGNVSQGTISDGIQLDTTFVPSLGITDVKVKEKNTNAVFTVRLSSPSQQTVTVNYTTADGSAKAPKDYTATTGTLTFNSDETTKTIAVPIRGDRRTERNETFFVNLSGENKATIADASGKGTIVDND